jgi:hypothetical protein
LTIYIKCAFNRIDLRQSRYVTNPQKGKGLAYITKLVTFYDCLSLLERRSKTMSDIQSLISNLGFPIFVAIYMMLQNQKLTETISDLRNAITELSTLIKEESDK